MRRFAWHFGGGPWGDLELVEVNEGLGKYFGTDSGVLVVSAPESDVLQLQDGDVIRSIDGREPTSVKHAMRILGSYQPGEKLKLEIMRDKRSRTLEIEIPDERHSRFFLPGNAPKPAAVPVAPRPSRPVERT
jgi:S1-C subfamily serine protease